MPVLSRRDLERMSFSLLTDYSKKAGKSIERISPEIMAGKVLGLSVNYAHLSKEKNILGLTSFSEVDVEVFDENYESVWNILDGKSILVESDLAVYWKTGVRNFTIMHECAHHILKRKYPETYGIKRRVHAYEPAVRRPILDWDEWQADVLASYLLMPLPLVYKGMESFDMKGSMENLDYKQKQIEKYKFGDLCDRLGCSPKALSIRFNQMGLDGDSYLKKYGPEMLEIYKDERE